MAIEQGVSDPAGEDPRIIWSVPLLDDPTSPPVVVDDTVYVTYGDPTFRRPTVNGLDAYFTANGTKKWHYSISEDPNAYFTTPVTVADHVACVGGWDGSVHSVNTDTGKRIWRYRTGAANHTTHYTVQSTPAIYNNLVIFGSDDGYVYAVTAREGRLQWKTDLTHDINVSVRGSPLIYEHMVYIGGDDRVLHVLDPTTGVEAWQFKAKDHVRGPMAVSKEGDLLYFSAGDMLYAISLATHQQKWVYQRKGKILSSPVVASLKYSDEVYVSSNDGYVHSFDQETGKGINWDAPVARVSVQPPTIIDGHLLVSSEGDDVHGGTISMLDGMLFVRHEFRERGSFKYPVAVKNGIAYAVASSPVKDSSYRDYTYLYAFDVFPSFTAQSRSGNVPFTVQFTDNSADGVWGYLWEFGDGTTSRERNPSHTYMDPRTYRVNLTIDYYTGARYTATRKDYVTATAWKDVLGGSDNDFGKISIQTDDGGLLVVGETQSLDGDIWWNHYPDGQQIVIEKYLGGERLGQHLFGGSNEQNANYVSSLTINIRFYAKCFIRAG
jgi:outer membrane protein assembly factor BamB